MKGFSALRDLSREQCAVVIGIVHQHGVHWDRIEVIPNHAENDDVEFEAHTNDVKNVIGGLYAHEYLVGFLHTHPDSQVALPSEADLCGVPLSLVGHYHFVYAPRTKKLTYWSEVYGNEPQDVSNLVED